MAVVEWDADLRQHKHAQRAFKLPVAHEVEFAKTNGVCETMEGSVPCDKGDAILSTGGIVNSEGQAWQAINYPTV